MTGYALTEKQIDAVFISIEIKSYNSRFLELNINLPFKLSGLEPFFKKELSKRCMRGKIDVNVHIHDKTPHINIIKNIDTAIAYIHTMKEIAERADIPCNIDINALIKNEGVITIEHNEDINLWEEQLKPVFFETVSKYDESKIIEGNVLKKDIQNHLNKIIDAVNKIRDFSPKMEDMFCAMFKERVNDLLISEINEQRIAQEVALMLVKYTINEEIVRLTSHCENLNDVLNQEIPVGKKIDFICQEINREINTIGSKSQIFEITQNVINAKDALENIREQSRNVE